MSTDAENAADRWYECQRKVAFESKKVAQRALAVRTAKQVKNSSSELAHLSIYHCQYCFGWHIGHRPGTGAKRAAMKTHHPRQNGILDGAAQQRGGIYAAIPKEEILKDAIDATLAESARSPAAQNGQLVEAAQPVARRHPGRQGAKLSSADEQEIVALFRNGTPAETIKKQFHIGHARVYEIVDRLAPGFRKPHNTTQYAPRPPAVQAFPKYVVTYEVRRTETKVVEASGFDEAARQVTNLDPAITVISVGRQPL